MTNKQADIVFSEEETKRRTETALRAAFNRPQKPMKDIPKKRVKAQRKSVGMGRTRRK